MRVTKNRNAWHELWRPSASSGMNGWDADDETYHYILLFLWSQTLSVQWVTHKDPDALQLHAVFTPGYQLAMNVSFVDKKKKVCCSASSLICWWGRYNIACCWYCLILIQPVYLHSMLAASLPSRSMRSNNDNSLSVPRVKTNTGARAFHSCAPSLWNNLQPIKLLLLSNIWRHIYWTWPFPHRYRHAPWPVDVTKLFARFCCWTPIWL